MTTLATVIGKGAIGSRPAAASAGRLYFSTEPKTYRDNGSSWDDVSDAGTAGNLTGDVTSVGLATTIGAGKVTEAMQVLANNTTGNVSTSKHGYVPILPNDATKYLDGTGAFSVPAGGGGGSSPLLGSQGYSTGSDAAWATITSATTVAIDATNAAVAVTIPASGKVLVDVELDCGFNYGSFPFANFLTLMIGSTEIAAAPVNWFPNAVTDAIYSTVGGRVRTTFRVTGLTPGAATIKVGMRSTQTQMAYANDAAGGSGHRAGPFVMAVWDAT